MVDGPRQISLLAIPILAVACTGSIQDSDGSAPVVPRPPGAAPMRPDDPAPPAEPPSTISGSRTCSSGKPGPRLLRRLSAEQLDNTVRDLFRNPNTPRSDVFNDPEVLGFSADAAALLVRDLGSQQLMTYAEQVAHWAVGAVASEIAPCNQMTPECRGQFVRQFGRRAFRQPLTDAQVARYERLFAGAASFEAGLELTITALLQSPYFLYRRELGQPDPAHPGLVRLTPFEVASSLSYLLTRSMPDDQLLAAAEANQLATREQIDAQVERLLSDPDNRRTVHTFMGEWLESRRVAMVLKDPNVFDLPPALRADMERETAALVEDVVFTRGGSLADLLTADYTFVNASLARHYGISGITGDQLVKVSGQRGPGVLGQGSVLAGHAGTTYSSPTLRGKLVRTRLLCETLPPPPDDVDTMIKVPASAKTTREIFEAHVQDPACSGCHRLMDPIGFAFENYDVVGRHRTSENGVPVDAHGLITGRDVSFEGLPQLVDYLQGQDDVRQCLVRFMSYAAYGAASWADDGCTFDAITTEAKAARWSIRSVLTAITHAPHFTSRVQ